MAKEKIIEINNNKLNNVNFYGKTPKQSAYVDSNNETFIVM